MSMRCDFGVSRVVSPPEPQPPRPWLHGASEKGLLVIKMEELDENTVLDFCGNEEEEFRGVPHGKAQEAWEVKSG